MCVVLGDRANYGRLKPVMTALAAREELEMQVVCAGTMVLERFGLPIQHVIQDGFHVDAEIYLELEGSAPATMARSLGLGVMEFSSVFQRLKPDLVLLIGDRYEVLAAALAAAYMNRCIVHIQGGEVSGSIDESARHAISKFAHYHVPSTARSAEFLIRLGERPETVLTVGCPSSDLARHLEPGLPAEVLNSQGSGSVIDPEHPYVLAIFHPVSSEYGGERQQMEALLEALHEVHEQTVVLWPNIDAGADQVSKAIRVFQNQNRATRTRTLINLVPESYLKLLRQAACAVGNSSSFVREAGYFGTPVVLVGSRQDGREAGEHVTRTPPERGPLVAAVRAQLAHGRYPPLQLYGDGRVSERIAQAVSTLVPYTQKRLSYCEGLPWK